MRTHFRKRNPTKRCYVCKELGHLERNCMNQDNVNNNEENKGNTKIDEIKTQRNQQWIRKSPKSSSQNSKVIDT